MLAPRRVPPCLIVSVAVSTSAAFFQPAIGAAIPDLVPAKKVAAANSMSQFSVQIATFLGQGTGGHRGLLRAQVGQRRTFPLDVRLDAGETQRLRLEGPDPAGPLLVDVACVGEHAEEPEEGAEHVLALRRPRHRLHAKRVHDEERRTDRRAPLRSGEAP